MRGKLILITRHSLSVLSLCRLCVREGISLIYSLLSAINADNVDRLISRPARAASLALRTDDFISLCLAFLRLQTIYLLVRRDLCRFGRFAACRIATSRSHDCAAARSVSHLIPVPSECRFPDDLCAKFYKWSFLSDCLFDYSANIINDARISLLLNIFSKNTFGYCMQKYCDL